jgi:hypothetical protein
MKLVAVVVPVSDRSLTADEEISLRHLTHYLSRYDKYALVPKGRPFSYPALEVMTLPKRFFGSFEAHTRMQLSEEFYAWFGAYRYILMYHLDALVLSDRLSDWCSMDLDYIGAPWIPCDDTPWVRTPAVGNSGFALMNVQSFLAVMRSKRPSVNPDEYWKEFAVLPVHRRIRHLPRKYLKRLPVFNSVRWEMRRWLTQSRGLGADYFWSQEAKKYLPEFKVASVEQGLEFAFEAAPRLCFELNRRRLPFGSHAWARYDRAFWEPYLLQPARSPA